MLATDQPPVIAAELDDLPDLVGLVAAYEWDSPVAAWLVPDVLSRPGVLMAWYSIQAEQALRHGYVDMTRDGRAVAIWLDQARPRRRSAQHLRRVTSACGRHAIALLTYEHLLTQHQPRGGHLRLVALAADAKAAATLLAHRHRCIDGLVVPAYATASSAEQRRVLTAAGYMPAPPCRIPGGPDVWPLWRLPGNGQTTADSPDRHLHLK
jgi:hypothetical protein